MEPMLDKDFDAIFKSSFEDYEVTPATDSWTKISEQINPKPKRKSFPVFWMAAASIIIVLGVGIGLYTNPVKVIKLHPDGENEMMDNLAKEQTAPISAYVAPENIVKETKQPVVKTVPSNKPIKENRPVENVIIKETPSENTFQTMEIASVKNIKLIRQKLVTEQLIEQEAISDIEKKRATKINESTFIANAPAENTLSTKKLKISSVGDLVNFVVAKVDKRDEKIIKMSKTDESDNEITGINLGLIKFSKQD